MKILSKNIVTIKIIPLDWSDFSHIRALYNIRTHPLVIPNFFSPPPTSMSQHLHFIENIREAGNWNFFLAKNETSIIGYTQVVDRGVGIEVGFAVHPDWWRKKIGSQLVNFILTYLEVKNTCRRPVFLRVKNSNELSIRLYEKYGFSIKKLEDDCITMEFLNKKN